MRTQLPAGVTGALLALTSLSVVAQEPAPDDVNAAEVQAEKPSDPFGPSGKKHQPPDKQKKEEVFQEVSSDLPPLKYHYFSNLGFSKAKGDEAHLEKNFAGLDDLVAFLGTLGIEYNTLKYSTIIALEWRKTKYFKFRNCSFIVREERPPGAGTPSNDGTPPIENTFKIIILAEK